MPTLAELQQALVAAVLDGDEDVASALRGDERLDASGRLAVYRHSVRGALSRALAEIYPVVRRLVGERFFDALAARYIPAHPSRSPDLHDYGEALPRFLESFAPADPLPYLPDVARLEWAWHRAFHAADPAPAALDALARLPPARQARTRFALAPGVALLASPYPVDRIWQANQPQVTEPPTVSLDAGPVRLIVFREADQPKFERLEAPDCRLLEHIAGGAELGALAATEPTLDRRLPALFARAWIAVTSPV